MRKIARVTFLIFICLISFFIYSAKEIIADENKRLSEVSVVDRIFNFHFVAPNVMRGSQPSMEEFKHLRNYYKVKTVLSLRRNNYHNKQEEKVVNKLGMDFINIPMNGRMEQSRERIEKYLNIINATSAQPIFVHCRGGKDRTGLIFAAYRIKYNGWSLNEALTEMLAYGYDKRAFPALKESLIKWNQYKSGNDTSIHRKRKR